MTVRVVVHRAAMRDILRSDKVAADLARRAAAIAARADENADTPAGHRVDSQLGRRRARSAVITAVPEAMWKERERRTLTSAIDAGRR